MRKMRKTRGFRQEFQSWSSFGETIESQQPPLKSKTRQPQPTYPPLSSRGWESEDAVKMSAGSDSRLDIGRIDGELVDREHDGHAGHRRRIKPAPVTPLAPSTSAWRPREWSTVEKSDNSTPSACEANDVSRLPTAIA
jgi:hypothetical protein